MYNNILFAQQDLEDYVNQKFGSAGSLVEQITPAQVLATGAPALVQGIVGQLRIEPLVLHDSLKPLTYSEVTLSVHTRPAYREIDRGPVPQPGHQLRMVVPFTGDPLLWGVRPQHVGTGLTPRGTVDAAGNTLTLTIERTDPPSARYYEGPMDEMLQRIQTFINYQTEELNRVHAELGGLVLQKLPQP